MFLLTLLSVAFMLIGCEEDGYKEMQAKINELESDLNEKISQLDKSTNRVAKLEEENQKLKQDIIHMQTSIHTLPTFNVFEEKMFFEAETLSYDKSSVTQIKNLLGKPQEMLQEESPLNGFLETTLVYNEGKFVFYNLEDKQFLKAYFTTSPLFTTARGISVGSSKEDVMEVYKEEVYKEYKNSITLGEKTGMAFDFENDVVTKIYVWFEYE
jgi:outer membrane murein-binding lipoprotein Lpp